MLSDVDGVIYCASAFNAFRQRLPDRLDNAANAIAKTGMALFELRFGDALFGSGRRRSDGEGDEANEAKKARQQAVKGKTADVEGLELVVQAVRRTQVRQATHTGPNPIAMPMPNPSPSTSASPNQNPNPVPYPSPSPNPSPDPSPRPSPNPSPNGP